MAFFSAPIVADKMNKENLNRNLSIQIQNLRINVSDFGICVEQNRICVCKSDFIQNIDCEFCHPTTLHY